MNLKMSSYKNLFGLLILIAGVVFAFTACTKVIKLDLNTANPQVVIQAYVTDLQNIDTVKLTRTGSYFSLGTYPTINGATVVISDNTGLIDTLKQVDSGLYAPINFIGVPGKTYSLKVLIGGKEYNAVSTMPAVVDIDSVTKQTINTGFDIQNRIRCYFRDPLGPGNYYMASLMVNTVLRDSADDINIAQDKFDDGTEVNLRIRGYNAVPGDTVTIKLMCIDASTYNYFNVVRSIAASGNPVSTAVPQNPPTNIIGGALGYFSAHTIRSKTIVVP